MPRRRMPWERLPDDELLDWRLCDLGLRVEGSALAKRVARLGAELGRAGLRFRPYVWLSTDFFTPDGTTGFAVPFYLAHPRLVRLEHRQMLEAEGAEADVCLRILRHEAAHALDNAFHLHRRRRWREVFGRFTTPYREAYVPRPTSRRYVLNLDFWYAQSHPCEDYAETFSVWLQPGSRWRHRYAGWPALKKLEYLDGLMKELAGARPLLATRERPQSLPTLRTTLREYYREKQARYRDDTPRDYDEPLQRVFARPERGSRAEGAAQFLERTRADLRRQVVSVTGQHPYLISQVLNELALRCRSLGLRVARPERETLVQAASLLTLLTMSSISQPTEYRR